MEASASSAPVDPEWLHKEIKAWIAEGLLSAEQGERILHRYSLGGTRGLRQNRMIAVLVTLGALLLGTGVILFFAANWEAIPRAARVAMVLAAISAAYLAGYALKYGRGNLPRAGAALLFLGGLLYGAAIFLIAQMYQISAHFPNGILLWLAGVLPLAYLLDSLPLLLLSLALLPLWLGMEIDPTSWGFTDRPVLYLSFGALQYALAGWHRRLGYQAFSRAYGLLGIAWAGISVYALTFNVFEYRTYAGDYRPSYLAHYLGYYLPLTAAALVLLIWRPGDERRRAARLMHLAFIALLAFACLPVFLHFARPVVPVILFNLVFAACIIGLIAYAYAEREAGLFNLGVAFFALDFVTRYFDWFFSLLDRSLFFILGGYMLIHGGLVLERRRRRLLGRMKELKP